MKKYYRLVTKKNRSIFVYSEEIVDDKVSMANELMPNKKIKWAKKLSNSTRHTKEEIWQDKFDKLGLLDFKNFVGKEF